jgi:hypothetical protein
VTAKRKPVVTAIDPPVGPRLYTAEQVAAALHIVPQSLAIRRMKGGPLSPPFIRLGGKTSRPYYRADEFDRWMAERESHIGTHEERIAAHQQAKASKPRPTRIRKAGSAGRRS